MTELELSAGGGVADVADVAVQDGDRLVEARVPDRREKWIRVSVYGTRKIDQAFRREDDEGRW